MKVWRQLPVRLLSVFVRQVMGWHEVLDPDHYIGKTCTACLLAAFVLTFLLVYLSQFGGVM